MGNFHSRHRKLIYKLNTCRSDPRYNELYRSVDSDGINIYENTKECIFITFVSDSKYLEIDLNTFLQRYYDKKYWVVYTTQTRSVFAV